MPVSTCCCAPPPCSTTRVEEFARTLSLEEGKPLTESLGEVGRCPDLLRLSAFEGAQPRRGAAAGRAANGAGKFGMALRSLRRRRRDHAVQLPDAARPAQGRAGARGR